MQWLISKLGPKYILDKTIDGATPLHMAAGTYVLYTHPPHDCRYILIYCTLMERMPFNIPLLPYKPTAQGYTDILRYFLDNLENKSDVNVQDHIHATPAHDAAEYGQMQAMLLLLKNGADVSIKDTVSESDIK